VWSACGSSGIACSYRKTDVAAGAGTYGGGFLDRRPHRSFSWKKTTSSRPGRFFCRTSRATPGDGVNRVRPVLIAATCPCPVEAEREARRSRFPPLLAVVVPAVWAASPRKSGVLQGKPPLGQTCPFETAHTSPAETDPSARTHRARGQAAFLRGRRVRHESGLRRPRHRSAVA